MIGFLDDTLRRPFYLSFETPDIVTSETVTTVCAPLHTLHVYVLTPHLL